MSDLFARIVLGHLVGDYLLQSRSMALHKAERTWKGDLWCLWHCLLYTVSVSVFLQTIDPLIITLIFLSHWPIDRWSLTSIWLRLIRGRDVVRAYSSTEKYHEIDLIFSCLVYAVADNTLHLIFLWLIGKLL